MNAFTQFISQFITPLTVHQIGQYTEAEWIRKGILVILLCLTARSDWRYHKIFNKHTYPAVVIGTLLSYLFYGMDGLKSTGYSVLATCVFCFIFYIIHWLSAGDVKLFIATATLQNAFFLAGALIIGMMIATFYFMVYYIRTAHKKMEIPVAVFYAIGFFAYQGLILILHIA